MLAHAARWNGTQCYEYVRSRACEFYFGLSEVSDCNKWCESANSTGVDKDSVQDTWRCDGEDEF